MPKYLDDTGLAYLWEKLKTYVQTAIGGKAPTNHASTGTSYGVGTSGNYGHVKVRDTLGVTSFDANAPEVLSAYRGYLLDQNKLDKSGHTASRAVITDGNGNITVSETTAAQIAALRTLDTTSTIQTQIDGKAAKNHQSTGTDYGIGTAAAYGHLKIANNLTTASFDSDAPVALSAYQGKVLKDTVDGKAPTSHAASTTDYGAGTQTNYGHVKLRDDLTASAYTTGEALSSHQGKVLQDNIGKVTSTLPAIGTSDASSKSVATNTNVNLGSISLTPGLWLIVVTARWASNANGARQLWLSTTSTGEAKDYASMVSQRPVSGAITMMQLVVFASVTTNTTYYIVGKQTIGSSTSINVDVRHSTARLGDVPSS